MFFQLCYLVLFSLFLRFPQLIECEKAKKENVKEEVLPPCQACKTLINSFMLGVNATNKKYANDIESEELNKDILVEIKSKLCTDVKRGQNQCYKLAEDWNDLLQNWWFNLRSSNPDLHAWLCIEKVEHCCPDNHFGLDCKPCEGFPDNICSKNGKCKGAGTRKGNGECSCNVGYAGSKCDSCAPLHFESYKDDSKFLCSKCHKACKGSCTSSGPKACASCNPGWINDPEHGCLDINECATLNPCKMSEFCINNEGSYICLRCDPSCDGCHGDGPDMCLQCAKGFFLKDGICTQRDRDEPMDWARYFTYFGLCVATCIIFQKNTVIASFIGLFVAIYVSVSEYMLSKL